MTIWDIIALITGIVGVYLTIKQNSWCWPIATISVIISGVTFFNARLFGDFAMQLFYCAAGIYGWFYWKKNNTKTFIVTKMPNSYWLYVLIGVLCQTSILYFILTYFKGDQIIFDAILTACSFTCTFLMTKKWLQNWLFWIVIDLAYVFLYLLKDLPTYAVLNLIFAIVAAYGYFTWKNQLKPQL